MENNIIFKSVDKQQICANFPNLNNISEILLGVTFDLRKH